MRAQRKTLTKRANKKGTKKRRSRRYKQQGGAEAKAAVASLAKAAEAAADELNNKTKPAVTGSGSAEARSESAEARSKSESELTGLGDCTEVHTKREADFNNLQKELEKSQQKVNELQAMMKESHDVFEKIMDEYKRGLELLSKKLVAKDNADSLDNADSPGRRDNAGSRRYRRDSLGDGMVRTAASMLSGGLTEMSNVSPPTRSPSPNPEPLRSR